MAEQTDRRLDDKIVVVTGGRGSIGGAVVDRSLALGATVVGFGRSMDPASGTDRFFPRPLDVSDSKAVDDAFAWILDRFGRIDALVHAAGVSTGPEFKARVAPQLNRRFDPEYPVIDGLLGTTDEDWRRLIAINLDGAFYCLRAALRPMVAAGRGDVVMISSNAGLMGEAGAAPYSASKGGSQLLMQAAAVEVIGAGVRVNAVAPGPTQTPFVQDSAKAGLNFLSRIPARRVAQPDEIARAVEFLLTQNDGYIVGETINVNGGLLVR